jgi:hypothetical protein
MSNSFRLREPEPPAGRFVPKGIDAQSWLGFEQRIQDRRYGALIESMRTAIAAGDAAGARIALEEARELRPGAEELETLASRIAAMPLSRAASTPVFRSRAARAVLLLLGGITLLTGIDYLRSDPSSARVIAAPPMRVPGLRVPLPELRNVPHPVNVPVESVTQFPIGTSGLDVRLDGELTIPESLRASSAIVGEPLPLPPGETPDDFVYPRETRPAPSRVRLPVERPGTSAASLPQQIAAVGQGASPASVPGAATDAAPLPQGRAATTPAATLPTTTAAAAAPAAVPPAAPIVSPARPPAVIASVAASPASPGVPTPTPSTPATFGRNTASRPVVTVPEDARVEEVLRAYARAYSDLDAAAARQVWPSVDERALARAFSTLSAQTLSFADCRIDVQGETAHAACRGYASYVGRVGSGTARTEPRQWRFDLRRVGEDWRIENAIAAR